MFLSILTSSAFSLSPRPIAAMKGCDSSSLVLFLSAGSFRRQESMKLAN